MFQSVSKSFQIDFQNISSDQPFLILSTAINPIISHLRNYKCLLTGLSPSEKSHKVCHWHKPRLPLCPHLPPTLPPLPALLAFLHCSGTQLRAFYARALSSPSFLFPQIILMASFPTASLHSNLYLNANISEMLFLTPCLDEPHQASSLCLFPCSYHPASSDMCFFLALPHWNGNSMRSEIVFVDAVVSVFSFLRTGIFMFSDNMFNA